MKHGSWRIDHLIHRSAAAGRGRLGRKTKGLYCVLRFSKDFPLSFRDPSSHRAVLVGDDSFIGEASFVEMTVSMAPPHSQRG
jgi:hypothetical protein